MRLVPALLALLFLPLQTRAQPSVSVEVGAGRLEGAKRYLTTGVIGTRLTAGPYRWSVRAYQGTRCGFVGCEREALQALTGTMTFGVRHGNTTVHAGGGGGYLWERWIVHDFFGTPSSFRQGSFALPLELDAEVALRGRWHVFVRGVALLTMEGDDQTHRSFMVGVAY